MIETIFYFLGSIFFFLSITFLAVIVIYSVKILRKVINIETEIKNTVVEAKNKIASFSLGFAALTGLLEKIIQMRSGGDGQAKKRNPKDKKEKKIADEE